MAVRARQGIFYEWCKTWNYSCRLFEINVREVLMFAIFLTILAVGLIITFGSDAVATSTANGNSASNNPSHPELFTGLIGASKALKRISQVDPGQYASPQDYNTWWNAACSAASMTEVINAYGHNYRLA